MKLFKFLWSAHKWTGIVLGIVLLNLAVTGFLLLFKKDLDWVQPPTRTGRMGTPGQEVAFLPMREVLAAVMAQDLPEYRNGWADVDRIDFRPARRVHKIRSRHNFAEVQVCAVTGDVLSVDWRPSDLIEQLHDGSFYAGWLHDWLMPLVALGLGFLVVSGVYIWIWPVLQKRRRRVAARAGAAPGSGSPG